jgi:hypothetical protein
MLAGLRGLTATLGSASFPPGATHPLVGMLQFLPMYGLVPATSMAPYAPIRPSGLALAGIASPRDSVSAAAAAAKYLYLIFRYLAPCSRNGHGKANHQHSYV